MTVGQSVVRGKPEADSARDAHVESTAKGHAEPGVSGTAGKSEGGSAGTERSGGVRDTEKPVGERRRSRVITQFQLWPDQEIEHPRMAICGLGWTGW